MTALLQDAFGEAAPIFAPGASQAIDFDATSAAGTAFAASVRAVMVYADQDCFVAIGDDPTALDDGSDMLVPLGETRLIKVAGGDRIAVIRRGADGTLFVTELR